MKRDEDPIVALCPRALGVLRRHPALRGRLELRARPVAWILSSVGDEISLPVGSQRAAIPALEFGADLLLEPRHTEVSSRMR
jgi:hypothetical protein